MEKINLTSLGRCAEICADSLKRVLDDKGDLKRAPMLKPNYVVVYGRDSTEVHLFCGLLREMFPFKKINLNVYTEKDFPLGRAYSIYLDESHLIGPLT